MAGNFVVEDVEYGMNSVHLCQFGRFLLPQNRVVILQHIDGMSVDIYTNGLKQDKILNIFFKICKVVK